MPEPSSLVPEVFECGIPLGIDRGAFLLKELADPSPENLQDSRLCRVSPGGPCCGFPGGARAGLGRGGEAERYERHDEQTETYVF